MLLQSGKSTVVLGCEFGGEGWRWWMGVAARDLQVLSCASDVRTRNRSPLLSERAARVPPRSDVALEMGASCSPSNSGAFRPQSSVDAARAFIRRRPTFTGALATTLPVKAEPLQQLLGDLGKAATTQVPCDPGHREGRGGPHKRTNRLTTGKDYAKMPPLHRGITM